MPDFILKSLSDFLIAVRTACLGKGDSTQHHSQLVNLLHAVSALFLQKADLALSLVETADKLLPLKILAFEKDKIILGISEGPAQSRADQCHRPFCHAGRQLRQLIACRTQAVPLFIYVFLKLLDLCFDAVHTDRL